MKTFNAATEGPLYSYCRHPLHARAFQILRRSANSNDMQPVGDYTVLLAAIAGNVLVALPVAIAIAVGLGYWHGEPAVPLGKAAHLLDDLDPLSWAIPHAAIAGFYLFLSGLITGYFDNRASYDDIGPRIGRLRWLRRLVGSNGAQRIGRYISERMGGIMGNFLFGCMLGSTGILGSLLGLPLDIRHIAFASANLGYALTGFDFALPLQAALWALLGIAAIGFKLLKFRS